MKYSTFCFGKHLMDGLAGTISEALAKVFDGINCPHVSEIDNGSDDYDYLVSSRAITPEQAADIWEVFYDNCDENQVYETPD